MFSKGLLKKVTFNYFPRLVSWGIKNKQWFNFFPYAFVMLFRLSFHLLCNLMINKSKKVVLPIWVAWEALDQIVGASFHFYAFIMLSYITYNVYSIASVISRRWFRHLPILNVHNSIWACSKSSLFLYFLLSFHRIGLVLFLIKIFQG